MPVINYDFIAVFHISIREWFTWVLTSVLPKNLPKLGFMVILRALVNLAGPKSPEANEILLQGKFPAPKTKFQISNFQISNLSNTPTMIFSRF